MKNKFKDRVGINVTGLFMFGIAFIFSLLVVICTWNIKDALIVRIIFSISGILCLAVFFVILLNFLNTEICISDSSISMTIHGRKKIISYADISLIADVHMGRDRYFVIYPNSVEPEIIDKHLSIHIDAAQRSKLIVSDERIIFFTKTEKAEKLLQEYGYSINKIVD